MDMILTNCRMSSCAVLRRQEYKESLATEEPRSMRRSFESIVKLKQIKRTICLSTVFEHLPLNFIRHAHLFDLLRIPRPIL